MAKSVEDQAALIVGIFVLTTILAYVYAPDIVKWSQTAGFFESTAIYILTNPVYLVLVLYLSHKFHIKGLLASLLVVLALDIQSLPHVVTDGINTDPATFLFIDSIIFRYFHVNLFVLYVVIPIGLMILASEVVSKGMFVRIVRRYIG